jgi:hypothetical protein
MTDRIKKLESDLAKVSDGRAGSKDHIDLLVNLAGEIGLTDEHRSKALPDQQRRLLKKIVNF